jgi:hypothetical protein
MQKEKLTYNIMESALAEYGLYWRPLTHRGIPSLQAKTRKEARNKVDRAKEWGQKNGYPWIETVEDRWDHDEMFGETVEELNMTRADMIDYTNLSYERSEHKPQTRDWITKHIKGKFHLTSENSKGGSTLPLKDIPGYREELKNKPGKLAQKRNWEEDYIPTNITLGYPARGNSTANSSYEPRYHVGTAGSSNDTRRIKARSETTDYVERRPIEDWWGYPSYDDRDKRLPGESSLGKAVRLES